MSECHKRLGDRLIPTPSPLRQAASESLGNLYPARSGNSNSNSNNNTSNNNPQPAQMPPVPMAPAQFQTVSEALRQPTCQMQQMTPGQVSSK